MNKRSLCLLFLLLSTVAHPITGQSLWNIQPEAVDYATIGIKPSEFDSTESGRSEIIARIKTLMQEEPLTKYYSHAILLAFHVASSGIAGESKDVTVVLTDSSLASN